jgi:iron complex outermembrane receptor protein
LDPRPSYCSSPTPGTPCLIDASGNPTIHTPKFTGNLTAAYDIISSVGKFPLSITASYNSGFAFSTDDRLRQPSYTLLNAAAGWVTLDGKYGVTLWGSNLANKYYLEQGVPSSLGDLTAPAAPRTYGVTLKAKFGG